MSSTNAMRLAPIGQSASNIYNTYHYISQIAGLYSQAAAFDHRENLSDMWSELSMSVVDDIELMYKVWEKAHNSAPTDEDDIDLGKLILKSCNQIEKIEKLMDIWVDLRKWMRVMVTLEMRYQTILKNFKKYQTVYSRVYEKLCKDSQNRLKKMEELVRLFDADSIQFVVESKYQLTIRESELRSKHIAKKSNFQIANINKPKDEDVEIEILDD